MKLFDSIDISKLQQKEWEKLSDNEKLKILKQIEYNISIIQNRNVREIIYEVGKKNIEGEYIFADSNKIHLYNIGNVSKIIETIIHEGTHALVDDAVLGEKDSISLVSKIDSDVLSTIVSGRDIIHNHFAHLGNKSIEFNILYYEEQLARYESYIQFINGIFSIPNEYEQVKNELLRGILLSAVNYYIYCYNIQNQLGKFNDEVVKINFEDFKDKIVPTKMFSIINEDMSLIEQYFKDNMNKILRNNGFNEINSFSPYYLPDMINNINNAKQNTNLTSFETQEINEIGNVLTFNSSTDEEYEQLSDETKYIINSIIYYQSHVDQIQNIAIMNLIYPEFEEEIEKLGPDSKLYKYFHCIKGSGWAGFNIIENVKYAMNWKVEDSELYQRIIAFYETKREEIEVFSNNIAITLSLYKFSPELRQNFKQIGVDNLVEFLGINEHILMYGDVPNKYMRIKEQMGIKINNPREITPNVIASHFLVSTGSETLNNLIAFCQHQNLLNDRDKPKLL